MFSFSRGQGHLGPCAAFGMSLPWLSYGLAMALTMAWPGHCQTHFSIINFTNNDAKQKIHFAITSFVCMSQAMDIACSALIMV